MKILIVCLDNIGDVMLSTPVAASIREKFPDAHISMLVKEYAENLLLKNPCIDEIISFSPFWMKSPSSVKGTMLQTIRYIAFIRRKKFDTALIISSDWRKALFTWLCSIKRRIGADRKYSRFFLTEHIPNTEKGPRHRVYLNLDLLSCLGISENNPRFELIVSDKCEEYRKQFFQKNNINHSRPVISIHPFTGSPARSWSIEKFALLADRLIRCYNAYIIVFSSSWEAEKERHLARLMKETPILTCGSTSLNEMAAIIKHSALFVGHDSGPMHIAAALGTPVVALFDEDKQSHYAPLGDGHSVIKSRDGLDAIHVDEVYDTIRKRIEEVAVHGER